MRFSSLSANRSWAFSISCALLALACSSGGDGGDDGSDGATGGTGDVPGVGGNGTGGDTSSGGTAMGTGGSVVNNPGDYIFPDERGPRVTFSTYEAEDMQITGFLLGPTSNFGEVASEASGRKAVRLGATGESVSFVNEHPSNSIVIRYSIPDNGADYWAKLSVFVDGQLRTQVDVTSRYSWSYRNQDDNIFNQPAQNDPGAGMGHHFFDETRALIGDVAVGSTVMIQKSTGDNASRYDIDLVEMEQAPAPLPKPAGFVDFAADCGAVPNDNQDDSGAFQACIDANPGKGLYIPEGVFHLNSSHLEVGNVTIRGAGMWHSTIMGPKARFTCWGGNCRYYDFAVFGDTTARDDGVGGQDDAAFDGGNNNNVVLQNLWIEHRRVGYWTTGGGNRMEIRDSRFRNLHADAVNFYGGVTDSIVDNCHIRGTGDDGLAAWAHAWDGRATNAGNTFSHNYIQAPWKANCIGVYGGTDITVSDNVCTEVTQFSGYLVANAFGSHGFGGTNKFERNSMYRVGGYYYGGAQGAFKIEAREGDVNNIQVTDLDLYDSTFFGIHVEGPNQVGSTYFNDVTIENARDAGLFFPANAKGSMDATGIVVTGSTNGIVDDGANSFSVNRHDGNSGW